MQNHWVRWRGENDEYGIFRFPRTTILVVVGVLIALVSGRAGRVLGSDLDGRLANLFGQYRLIKTVDLRAIVKEVDYYSLIAKVAPLSPTLSKIKMYTGTIRWRYKAEGRKYYIKTVPSPGFAVAGNLIITYNDHQYDYFDRKWGRMSVRSKDMWSCPVLSPNPFFYPLSFMDKSNDQRSAYAIKLWQARSRKIEKRIIAETRWERRVPPGYSAVATVPASGTLDKHPFFYKIFFGQRVDYLPTRLEILRKGGGLIWRYDILSYAKAMISGHMFYWMKSGRLRVYNLRLRGKVLFDDRVDVQLCVLNQPLAESDFTIDWHRARWVYQIGTGQLLYDRATNSYFKPNLSASYFHQAGTPVSGTIVWPVHWKTTPASVASVEAQIQPYLPEIPYPRDWFSQPAGQQATWLRWWYSTPVGQHYLALQQIRLRLKVNGDGRFSILNVPPGQYILECSIAGTPDNGVVMDAYSGTQYFRIQPLLAGSKRTAINLGMIRMIRNKRAMIGEPAVPFTLETLGGSMVSLSDFKGKFVLLDFWATWCGPCRAQTPFLKRLYNRFGKTGKLTMISITLDTNLRLAREYVRAEHLPWIQASTGTVSGHSIENDYAAGIPEILLIGPSGKVVAINLYGKGMIAEIANAMAASGATTDGVKKP